MDFKNIVIASAANDCTIYAAEELKKYVRKVSGINLEITDVKPSDGCFFSLGRTAAVSDGDYGKMISALNGDGYYISAKDGNIFLAAKTDRGLIYAAYEYIEKFLGVRFLTAEEEFVPRGRKIALPTEPVTKIPLFNMRTYLTGDVFQKRSDADFIAKTRTVDLFTESDEAHGGRLTVYGRNCNHNFHNYVPFEVYGNDHPEFYRFIHVNGETLPTVDITNGLTESGEVDEKKEVSVVKIVAEEIKKDLAKYPELEVVCLTQEDGPYYFDDENNEKLAAVYKRSGILIRFCNAVIRRVNRDRAAAGKRPVKLMTFAYDYAKDAPVKEVEGKIVPIDETVVADENLIIQFALFCNGFYDYFSDKQYPFIKKTLKEWRAVAHDFWFWGYDTSFHRYLAYYDSFDNIEANVRGMKKEGITYFCMQGPHDTRKIWQNEIRAYAYRKLFYGDERSAAELTEEFIDLYYGAGAESVKKLMNIFHTAYKEAEAAGKVVTCGNFGTHERAEINPEKMLYSAVAAIERGEKAVKSAGESDDQTQKLLKRLAGVKATPLMLLYDNFYFYHPEGSKEEELKAKKAFFDTARFAEIDLVAERWTIKQYEDEPSSSERVVKLGEKLRDGERYFN